MKNLFIAALLSVVSLAAQANNIGMAFNKEIAYAPGNTATVTIQVYNDSVDMTQVSIEPMHGELNADVVNSAVPLDNITIAGKSNVFIPVNITVPSQKANYEVVLCAKGQPFTINDRDKFVVRACDTVIIKN